MRESLLSNLALICIRISKGYKVGCQKLDKSWNYEGILVVLLKITKISLELKKKKSHWTSL